MLTRLYDLASNWFKPLHLFLNDDAVGFFFTRYIASIVGIEPMTFRTTIPYSKHWATGRLDAKLQSVSFCWSTVGTTVSLAFSHKAMLKKSFNQIQKITIQGLWVQKHAFEFFLKIVRLCVGCWPVTVMALLQAFLTKQGQIEDKPSFLMFSTKKKKPMTPFRESHDLVVTLTRRWDSSLDAFFGAVWLKATPLSKSTCFVWVTARCWCTSWGWI